MTPKTQSRLSAFKWTLVIVLFVGYSIISVNKSWNDDFRAYYQAGKHILSQVNIYDQSVVEGGFLYSPFFALLMVPLSVLPQQAAATIWYLGNIVSLLFILSMAFYLLQNPAEQFTGWLKRNLRMNPADKALKLGSIFVLILSARFWLNSIEHGQVNLQVWAIVLAAVYFLKNDRIVIGSLFLSVGIITKILPALLLFYFVFKKRYSFVLLSLLWIFVFAIVPAVILGWQHNIDLLTYWFQKALSPGLTPGVIGVGDSNQSFPAMLTRFLSATPANEETGAAVNFLLLAPKTIGFLTMLSTLFFLAIIAASALLKPTNTAQRENIELSIVMLSAALMPALAWKAYFVVSILGYATIVYTAIKMRNGRSYRLIVSLTVISFVLHTLTSDGIWGWKIAHTLQSYSCVTFSMLSLYAALILMLVKQQSDTTILMEESK